MCPRPPSPKIVAFSIKDFSKDDMSNMQKEGLKGECPYGFTQASVRSQDMAALLHRMKQLNEVDHTEVSWRYCYDPVAWLLRESKEQTEQRYAVEKDKREKRDIYRRWSDSPEGIQYKDTRAREDERARQNGTYSK